MSKRSSKRSEITPSAAARQLWNFLMARGGRHATFTSDDLIRLTAERIQTGHRNDAQLAVQLVKAGWVAPAGDGAIKLAL